MMYYGIKGTPGFLHSACLNEYRIQYIQSTGGPSQIEDMTDTPPASNCVLCGGPLDRPAISANERAARALASKPADLRKRLQDAKSVLTREFAKRFGKGRFDFHGKRLVGENGLVLQWLTRMYPDQPISYRNQQTNRGTVVCLEIID